MSIRSHRCPGRLYGGCMHQDATRLLLLVLEAAHLLIPNAIHVRSGNRQQEGLARVLPCYFDPAGRLLVPITKIGRICAPLSLQGFSQIAPYEFERQEGWLVWLSIGSSPHLTSNVVFFFQQQMSGVPQRYRTQRHAIRLAACTTQ